MIPFRITKIKKTSNDHFVHPRTGFYRSIKENIVYKKKKKQNIKREYIKFSYMIGEHKRSIEKQN